MKTSEKGNIHIGYDYGRFVIGEEQQIEPDLNEEAIGYDYGRFVTGEEQQIEPDLNDRV